MDGRPTRYFTFFSRGSAAALFGRNFNRCAIVAMASACSISAFSSRQNASAACVFRSGESCFQSCVGRGICASVMSTGYVNIRRMPRLTVEGFTPVDVEDGKRLVLAIEQDAGVDILHACGGNARCTTCRVEFISGEPTRRTKAEQMKLQEKKELEGSDLKGVRLSCQIVCD